MMKLDLTAKYALAVSGGVDSMTMLHMFASLTPRPSFCVVTVNHNIRKQAQDDCNFVKKYCDSLNVDCRIVSVDVPRYAKERKISEETAARILRYEALNKTDCDYVCLAHHMGDNAETVLMHILRGAGAKGASGIRRQNGKYLRPLLDMTREEIEQYAVQHNVPYVHDSTNDETKYTRNFIRQKVLPLLKELNPNAEHNIVRFAENIAQDSDYLDGLVDTLDIECCAGYASIPTRILLLPKPLAYRAINKVFSGLGIYKDIEKTHIEAIIDLAQGEGGRQVDLPFGFIAVSDYDFITIQQAVEIEPIEFEIPFALGKTVTPMGVVEVSKTPIANALMIDVDKLPKDSTFRLRHQGDVFTKFGGGSKTLKKFLIDKKISQRLRDGLVLVAKDNEIYVICGVEISEKVKVDECSNVYYIAVTKETTNEKK